MSGYELSFQRFDARQARALRDMVESIYIDAYATTIASGHEFDSVEQFMRRFDAYTKSDRGFELVVAYNQDGEAIGQAWGWPLGPDAAWWDGLVEEEPEPGFTRETGSRTFALSEIMVRANWTGQGVAHRLHDELLGPRPETRATLLVEPDNERAYRAYKAWGWRQIGRLQPRWENAPTFHALILPLPLSRRT
ncbi:GNAT family N-acetyltransferase [Actinomadura syzygii]|uniref:GNAT family N-acetyltransferase n=2 Tax=Actinomadura syzygii TaxID=1427538 RepID=A0A5D0TV64_9ACTN|nr:GNAT family N-acetyltransferase [Actinomadura syzygii]